MDLQYGVSDPKYGLLVYLTLSLLRGNGWEWMDLSVSILQVAHLHRLTSNRVVQERAAF